MPIPSPAPYRRSNLTKEQKKEALNAIYGVTMPKPMSEEEAERIRELLANHDAENSNETDFDPSKVKVPYRFQKFPQVVYDHAHSYPAYDEEKTVIRGSMAVLEMTHIKAHFAQKVVNSQRELDAAVAAGWSETPPEFREEQESEPIEATEEAVPVRRRRSNVA